MASTRLLRTFVAALAVAGAIAGGSAGLGMPVVHADPAPHPAPEPPPPWAPRKPAEFWLGQPVVWWTGPTPGGHWGVWINGGFLNLS
ncbi:MAG TPA: hypothetical protein PKI77_05210 [Mycobacterium sp.]|nr:hypothetical protein [Mycobacterium sp.]